MIECPHCNFLNEEENQKCLKCGAPLHENLKTPTTKETPKTTNPTTSETTLPTNNRIETLTTKTGKTILEKKPSNFGLIIAYISTLMQGLGIIFGLYYTLHYQKKARKHGYIQIILSILFLFIINTVFINGGTQIIGILLIIITTIIAIIDLKKNGDPVK